MKKLILFVMLMMSMGVVSAQQRWAVTPELGMTAIKAGGGIESYSQAWNARWKIGVGVEYEVKPGLFSLKSGLYYTQRGKTERFMSYSNPVGTDQLSELGMINVNMNRHFLQVPLLANFSFKLADQVRLNLAAGPYVGYSVGNRYEMGVAYYQPTGEGYGKSYSGGSYGNGWSSTGEHFEGVNHEHPFDWGLAFQVGLEVKQWVFNVGYEASLGKEFKGDNFDMKYNTFSISVGYKFKIGK